MAFRPRVSVAGLLVLGLLALSTTACGPAQFLRPSVTPSPLRVVDAAVDSLAAEESVTVTPLEVMGDRIETEARRLFGDDSLADGDSTRDALDDYAGDLPRLETDAYAEHARVTHYIDLFTGTAKTRIEERLSRGTRYDAMIRAKLRAGGIPEDFRFLAFIESGFDPDAYSSAAAVGLWQFMPATARGVGLRVDWWMDERRDVVRSTDAAVVFLNQLHRQFGSLYLAAAAYNGGPGRVQRGLTRFARDVNRAEPDDRFFTLAEKNALATETKNYVPQLIAAAIIGRDPAAFGLQIDTMAPLTYDEVVVPPAVALAAVGAACGVDAAAIVGLNGQFLRGMTPPDQAAYTVRVPRGCAPGFEDRLELLEPEERSGVTTREARAGETLTALAKESGLTTTVLRQYNPKLVVQANGVIRGGTTITLPTAAARAAWRSVPDPSAAATSSGATYVVKRGDTLGAIAKRHGTTVATIKSLNGMKSDKIVAGKSLRVR